MMQIKHWIRYSLVVVIEQIEEEFYLVYQSRIYKIFLKNDYQPMYQPIVTREEIRVENLKFVFKIFKMNQNLAI